MSQVSCEPDVVHILDMSMKKEVSAGGSSSSSQYVRTTSTIINNRPLTIQTFKLEPGVNVHSLASSIAATPSTSSSQQPAAGHSSKIKLEPGLLQTLPQAQATPLKVEIQDNYMDSGWYHSNSF